MATQVPMPQLGESVVEGTVLSWLKKEGERVERDEPLVEVSTDKVDTEIPSPVSGTIVKVIVGEGETVEVGSTLCEIDEGGSAAGAAEAPAAEAKAAPAAESDAGDKQEATPAAEPEAGAKQDAAPAAEPKAEAETPAPAPAAAAKRAPASEPGQVLSPLVRRLAREHNVDVDSIPGTGAGGRVTKADVLAAASGAGASAPAASAAAAAPAAAPPQPAAAAAAPSAVQPPAPVALGSRDEVVATSNVRKVIARNMSASLQTSARAWSAVEVDMENIAVLRKQVGSAFKQREGYSLTWLPFVARAAIDALAAVPIVNSSLSADLGELTYHHYVNLGVSVAVDYGLVVPVIKGADAMNVVGIARAINDLATRARARKVAPDELSGSTFTITSPGKDSYISVPIINQPNSAIMSLEAVEQRVVAVDGMIAVRHRTFVCLSWDHRNMDGAGAVQFLGRVKSNLETWDFSHEVGAR